MNFHIKYSNVTPNALTVGNIQVIFKSQKFINRVKGVCEVPS